MLPSATEASEAAASETANTTPAPLIDLRASAAEGPTLLIHPESGLDALAEPILPAIMKKETFQWRAALQQSMTLLTVQQGFMLGTDKWARWSLLHGKFFKDYAASVRGMGGWGDDDPWIDNYVGHPLSGAVTGFVQVQNDPQGRRLTFSNSKAYWKSRAKAMAWSAAYSTQFEIGPISEASIENLGSFYYQNCATCKLTKGAGWVDIVVTPTAGAAWMVGEDMIDRYLIQRIERRLGQGKWTNFFRAALNPARMAANALRMKSPWHRDNRARPE